VNFANGMLNLTNWLGNVIMPTVAGLFARCSDLQLQQSPALPAFRLCGAGFPDVLGAPSRA